jgi:hypothetical protein
VPLLLFFQGITFQAEFPSRGDEQGLGGSADPEEWRVASEAGFGQAFVERLVRASDCDNFATVQNQFRDALGGRPLTNEEKASITRAVRLLRSSRKQKSASDETCTSAQADLPLTAEEWRVGSEVGFSYAFVERLARSTNYDHYGTLKSQHPTPSSLIKVQIGYSKTQPSYLIVHLCLVPSQMFWSSYCCAAW